MHHILIIEDEEVIRSAVQLLLQRHGYEVSVAESVEQAESNFSLQNFNLILS